MPTKKLTEFEFPRDIQILLMELNLCGKIWLIMSIYKPPKQNSPYFLSKLNEALIFYSKYDYTIISGDFNLEPTNPDLFEFLELNTFSNHVKNKTCWKSNSGRCIDLILSNSKHYVVNNTGTVETGLSDHHHHRISIMEILTITYLGTN